MLPRSCGAPGAPDEVAATALVPLRLRVANMPDEGDVPSSASGIARRVQANWSWLLGNYLAVVLLVWLCFALWHVSTRPELAIGIGCVVLLWLVLFRVMPSSTVTFRGHQFGKQHKEFILLIGNLYLWFFFVYFSHLINIAMSIALIALLNAVGTTPLFYMSFGVLPVLLVHSLLYKRAERYQVVDNKAT